MKQIGSNVGPIICRRMAVTYCVIGFLLFCFCIFWQEPFDDRDGVCKIPKSDKTIRVIGSIRLIRKGQQRSFFFVLFLYTSSDKYRYNPSQLVWNFFEL